ncbi:MAG: hypothetical protein US50_C0011G0003 [Candidatus Nomurabacteria bacterium GW2011_GWB1_37_5]|uniref:Outer membrane protein beta-barrel domain-containing protein n=1 Tax=Candidatus Nomurabacteria bacterium GW2011_GWB1_37_5 TaxID=1618742 RepID=A0A0G0HAQ7_9BACT|nr:MAG: hypothetical protein US50_C0011G0003 [Candidatus Nomurabacteria bacterium GW2011_GWB1_37_5]
MKKMGYILAIIVIIFFQTPTNAQSFSASIGSGFNLLADGENLNENFPTITGGLGMKISDMPAFISLEMSGRNIYTVPKGDSIIRKNFSNLTLNGAYSLASSKSSNKVTADAMIGTSVGITTSNESSFFMTGLFLQGNLNIPSSKLYWIIWFRPAYNYFNLTDTHPQLICNLSAGLAIRKKK